ncbi:MAG: sigma-54-dependent Fis family transcriptional regulator [Planctomycetes bacterium]|nr:sigma-54-dependent Fis family transcriptional regulator [Planctomycetota bacterium]
MPNRYSVLLVEPDPATRSDVEEALKVEGFRVTPAGDLQTARRLLSSHSVDALVTELRAPDGPGLDLVREAARRPESPVIVAMSDYPDTREVVEAMRSGALDVVEKPVYTERLSHLLQTALETRRTKSQTSSQPVDQLSRPPIIGNSPELSKVMDQIARVSATPGTTVLIQGESGTGKELVARAVHFDGDRRDHPFMAINCAALNESILEAELFGYEKGSFTGANVAGKKGLFEAADGGTVFLDEIGEMSQSLQAKLLRVLQENSFKRVGGVQDVNMDIRIIAATNRELWEEVASGRFRKDLYFRLNVMPIVVPPLRHRKDDIPELAHHFLERFAESLRKPIRGLSDEATRMLGEHPWPGNVRELRNVCEYAVIVCDGSMIEPRHLALHDVSDDAAVVDQASGNMLPLKDWSIRGMEEELIRMVLAETRFNITRAARELGINRSTLYNKMRDYGLSRDRREIRQSV